MPFSRGSATSRPVDGSVTTTLETFLLCLTPAIFVHDGLRGDLFAALGSTSACFASRKVCRIFPNVLMRPKEGLVVELLSAIDAPKRNAKGSTATSEASQILDVTTDV